MSSPMSPTVPSPDASVPPAHSTVGASPGLPAGRTRTSGHLLSSWQWAHVTCWLLALAAATSLYAVVVEGWGQLTIDAYARHAPGMAIPVHTYVKHQALAAMLGALSVVASGASWLLWQYRVAREVPRDALRFGPPWHVAAWLIPVVALVAPPLTVADVARASGAIVPRGVLAAWWACWIGACLACPLGLNLADQAADTDAALFAARVSLTGHLLLIAAAALAWNLVQRISRALGGASPQGSAA